MRLPLIPSVMRRTFVLVRIAGIEIAVHATWFLVAALLALGARAGVVPEVAPEASGFEAGLLSIAFVIIFYSFVVIHELSHAFVARAYGLEARRVTLFFFGGVAQMGREARDPAQELRVALAGPLASLVLAAGLALASRVQHPGHDGLPGLAGSFASINLALALFNLVPGFPLDGGRILRSVLWARTGDRARATRWAGAGGKLVAFALMGSGGAFLITGTGAGRGAVPGLWGIMLGWFLFGMSGGATAAEGGSVPGEMSPSGVAPPVNLTPPPSEERAAEPASAAVEPPERGVRSPAPPAKVKAHEGQAPSPNARRRGTRAKKGSRPPRAPAAKPGNRPRHPR